jgi:hypothetical protein
MFSKHFSLGLRGGSLAFLSAAAICGVLSLGSPPAAAVELQDLIGDWSNPDTNERLTIRDNGDWYHPKYGRAKIRRGTDASDIAVFYEGIETKCSYRVSIADRGRTMILAAADTRQDSDRCPAGRFKFIDR